MAYEVHLQTFEGPLDLLLHLIRVQKLDIRTIQLSLVTDQYLSYLKDMEELSLEIASEFVVVAATLLAIKSRTLLPQPAVVQDMSADEVDPQAALVLQLLAYQRCQQAAAELRALQLVEGDRVRREPVDLSPYRSTEPSVIVDASLWDLATAYREVLQRLPVEAELTEIRSDVVGVEEMMQRILRRLRSVGTSTFYDMLQNSKSRGELVSAFLALLELMKNGQVVCLQERPFRHIIVSVGEE